MILVYNGHWHAEKLSKLVAQTWKCFFYYPTIKSNVLYGPYPSIQDRHVQDPRLDPFNRIQFREQFSVDVGRNHFRAFFGKSYGGCASDTLCGCSAEHCFTLQAARRMSANIGSHLALPVTRPPDPDQLRDPNNLRTPFGNRSSSYEDEHNNEHT